MTKPRKYVSMDWAAKKLLRSKANFDILEGFLSELLREDIRIININEGESNKDHAEDKHNRVDLLVEDSKSRKIIIEIQFEHEVDYFQRILYGVSKVLVENIDTGQPYAEIVKVISISIVYFDLGQGHDYIYYGKTQFTGLHQQDTLGLNSFQKRMFSTQKIEHLFPEYYLLKINEFDDIAKNSLDEWIYFLKNEDIKGEFKAKGLQSAKNKLDFMKLSEKEQQAYMKHQEDLRYRASMIEFSIKRAEKEAHRADLEAQRAEQEAQRAEDNARQKMELFDKALKALIATGISEDKAREMLG